LLTSVLALRFVEQGKLDLDENVNNYLKTWKVPENEFTAKEKVTLRRLLTHTSGINRPDGGFSEEDDRVPTLLQVLNGEAPALNNGASVEYTPGSKTQYSNFAYIVIQLLLEDVSGKPYTQIVRGQVFEPLGMKYSTVNHPLPETFHDNTALPHDPEGKPHDRPQHPTALGHGGLVITPSDFALFAAELARAYRGDSDRLLSQKSARQMSEIVQELDPAQFFGMSGGLGVFLVGSGENLYFTQPGHNAPGTTCVLVASPVTGKGAVIMTNGAAGLQLSLEILPALVNTYHWPVIPTE
jgi:CubicO group peptidase (beta-lactamase class C family)